MTLPRVKFRKIDLDYNISHLKYAFFESSEGFDYHKNTLILVPELADVDISKSRAIQEREIEEIVTRCFHNIEDKIDSDIEKYDTFWEQYNDVYFKRLLDYFEIELPPNISTIYGNVGLLVTFPRVLSSFEFSISAFLDRRIVLGVVAHECLHFLWFYKWKQLFPNYNEDEFEAPSLIWLYSEMVVDPILNSKGINGILNFNAKRNDYFYKGEYLDVMNELKKIFSSNMNIDDKIRKGYELVLKKFDKRKGKDL